MPIKAVQHVASQLGARPEIAALPIWREAFTGLEWLSLHTSTVYSGCGIVRGEGEPVVLVPGFMASDRTLFELHAWLARVGYRPYFSGIGRNTRCPEVHIACLLETVERAHAETGERVTIIGHSLGGCFARGAAMKRPDLISQVISLGSPVQGARVHALIAAAAEFIRGSECTVDCYQPMQECLPESVAEANIYSKSDGIVDWQTCSRERGSESIEVAGTHIGLIWNAQVFGALGRLLAEHRHVATRPRTSRDEPRARRAADAMLNPRITPLRRRVA